MNLSRSITAWALGLAMLGGHSVQAATPDWGLCHAWPKRVLAPLSAEPGPIFLSADSSETHTDGLSTLSGQVLIQQSDMELRADKAEYSKKEKSIEASGNIEYDTSNLAVKGDRAKVLLDKHEGVLENSRYFLFQRHGRGESREVRLEGSDLTVLKQASYTTCDPGNDDWYLRASTVELDHKAGFASAYNARISFQGVPFFYIPYITFPISDKRITGLLSPSISSSDLDGTVVALPLYLNIHPQLDATLTPRNFTNRGLQTQSELRYLTFFGEGKLDLEHLNDKVYGDKRTMTAYQHQSHLGRWNADIITSRVSDSDYFRDFSDSLAGTSATHLERHLIVRRDFDRGYLRLLAQDYHTIDNTIPSSSRPYRRLPQLLWIFNSRTDSMLEYGVDSELVRFQRQERLNATRFDLTPMVRLRYERPAGFIIPTLKLRHTQYRFDKDNPAVTEERLERNLPIFTLDSGLFLERDAHLGETGLLQTLEPRLFYVSVPYRDQTALPIYDTSLSDFSSSSLFRDNRFTGADRVGDTEQVSLSLTSRLLDGNSGHEYLRGTLGQIYYLQDRKVGLSGDILDQTKASDTILEGEVSPSTRLSLKATLLWDEVDKLVTRRNVRLQYLGGQKQIFNFGYRDQGNRITDPTALQKEIDTSVLWPIDPRWSIIGRRYHSLPDDRTIEKMVGMEYSDCCWNLRFVRRAILADVNDLRYSWHVQLELKGLTSIGHRIEDMMENGILGYKSAP